MRDIRINKRDEQQRRSSFNFTWDFPVHFTVAPFQPFIISGEPLLSANPSRTHLHRGRIFLCTASTRHRQARNITRSRGSSLTKPGSLTYLFFFFFLFFSLSSLGATPVSSLQRRRIALSVNCIRELRARPVF